MKCTINYNWRGDCIWEHKALPGCEEEYGEHRSRFSRDDDEISARDFPQNVAARRRLEQSARYRYEILVLYLLISLALPGFSTKTCLVTRSPENVCEITSKERNSSHPIGGLERRRDVDQNFVSYDGENVRIMRTPLSTPEDRIFQECSGKAHKRRRRGR